MPKDTPNILLIVCDSARADAYRHDDLNGYYNWVETPVADQLAREGLTFTHAFTPIGICHPARACLDSGLYAHANGQLANIVWDKQNPFGLYENAPSVIRLLQSAGYRTGYTGQRHLKQSAFDDVVPGAITGFKLAGLKESLDNNRPQRLPYFATSQLPTSQHRDAFTVRGATELLRRYAAQDKPWLLHVDYDGPHPPFYLPEEWARKYDPAQIPKPPNFDDDGTGKQYIHSRARLGQMPEPWGEAWQNLVAHYAGYVSMLDSFTGEILAELDRLNLANDTVVIFTSDHGEMAGGHGTVTKYPQMYDEVYRVPLLVRWPGHTQTGSVENSFVSHVDVLPTFADLAGGPMPTVTHGQSWASRARGESLPNPRTAILAQLHGWGSGGAWYSLRMVRTHDWKYVFSPFAPDELYDLQTDPAEKYNLASELPDQVAAMRALMRQEMEAVGDPLAGHSDLKARPPHEEATQTTLA